MGFNLWRFWSQWWPLLSTPAPVVWPLIRAKCSQAGWKHPLWGNRLREAEVKTRVSSNVDDTVMPHLTYCKKGGFLIKHHVQRDTYTCYEEGSHNTRSENKHVQRYMKLLRTTPQVCNFNPTFAVHSDHLAFESLTVRHGSPCAGSLCSGRSYIVPVPSCPRLRWWSWRLWRIPWNKHQGQNGCGSFQEK